MPEFLGFSQFLSDFSKVSPILSEFGRILSGPFKIWFYSLIFSRILFVFFQFLSDLAFFRFSPILSDYVEFSQILSDSVGFSRILSNSFRFLRILFDLPYFLVLLSYYFRFCWIFSDFFGLYRIFMAPFGFLWILSDSLRIWQDSLLFSRIRPEFL